MKMEVIPMDKKYLVTYFSASGVTGRVAQTLARAIKAPVYEIRPQTPYTDADLDWHDKTSRSTVEMQDPASRPPLADRDAPVADADVIFVGFPIWWYVAPTIINTFLEAYDFSGKTVVLFATSGGSGFGKTTDVLRPCVAENTILIEGGRLESDATQDQLTAWVQSLSL